MDLDYILRTAQPWKGIPIQDKRGYFAPDEDAPYGRYHDGKAMSEHPSNEEINDHWEFWVSLANAEQKQVVQGMFDMGIAYEFSQSVKNKQDYEVVEEAIKWWMKHYSWEYKEFTQYIAEKKSTLINSGGWDATKMHKFSGAIPQRVKQLVMGCRPELCRNNPSGESPFQKLFYSIYTKATIGGR